MKTITEIKNKVGRPLRKDRPVRSAAKRTHPGEERYLVTLKTEHIAAMKDIALKTGIDIKSVYGIALSKFIKKHLR